MFPTFKLRLNRFKLDGQKYGLVLGRHIQAAMRIAAREFLLEVVKRIPVWTGFLRGAFGNLEDLVGTVASEANTSAFKNQSHVRGGQRFFIKKNRNANQIRVRH